MRIRSLYPSSTSNATKEMLNGKGTCRLLTAAVVNREFCNLLLTNPALALEGGYHGESFQLGTEEQELILSIRATSLADFAAQLAHNGSSHTKPVNGNGHSHNSYGENAQE